MHVKESDAEWNQIPVFQRLLIKMLSQNSITEKRGSFESKIFFANRTKLYEEDRKSVTEKQTKIIVLMIFGNEEPGQKTNERLPQIVGLGLFDLCGKGKSARKAMGKEQPYNYDKEQFWWEQKEV